MAGETPGSGESSYEPYEVITTHAIFTEEDMSALIEEAARIKKYLANAKNFLASDVLKDLLETDPNPEALAKIVEEYQTEQEEMINGRVFEYNTPNPYMNVVYESDHPVFEGVRTMLTALDLESNKAVFLIGLPYSLSSHPDIDLLDDRGAFILDLTTPQQEIEVHLENPRAVGTDSEDAAVVWLITSIGKTPETE